MSPYLLTAVFLMLMSILTSSEVLRFSQGSVEQDFFTHSTEAKSSIQLLTAISRVDDFMVHETVTDNVAPKKGTLEKKQKSGDTRERKSAPLEFNLDRPPNNSRLNFYLLLNSEFLIKGYPKDFSLYETAACLMRSLYKGANFYENGCEYEILETLLKSKEETEKFTTPDELSSLTFEDEKLQKIFFYMLKGHDETPPFLNYITFDKDMSPKSGDKKINFVFANEEILRAVFPNKPELVDRLLSLRASFWEKIITQEEHRQEMRKEECKNRKQFKEELTHSFESLLEEAGLASGEYKKVFDLSLGHSGSVLLVYDSLTGITKREKVQKAPKKSKQKDPT